MESFRIIAIKTGENNKIRIHSGAQLDPLKLLKPKTVYSFYSHFRFPSNNFCDITYESVDDFAPFSIKNIHAREIPVNINAIVGANGSGKSTLIELLYWANYNIGCTLKLLRDSKGRYLKPYKFLNLEILYSTSKHNFYIVSLENGEITKQQLILDDKKLVKKGTVNKIRSQSDLAEFFYSIAVNYSHYSLNSLEVGPWINALFHKNDAYQTPIVINPMRVEGNIDINTENDLLNRRLLANILEDIGQQSPEGSLRHLTNSKIATTLNIKYDSTKNPLEPIKNLGKGAGNKDLIRKVIQSLNSCFSLSITIHEINNNNFIHLTVTYIVKKLIKMSKTYKILYKYQDEGDTLKYLKSYMNFIKQSSSHIVFKVKGAILYLMYYDEITQVFDFITPCKFSKNQFSIKPEVEVDIDLLSKTINDIHKKEKNFPVLTSMMIPPPFFDIEILLINDTNNTISLNTLSSGEKQRIHSLSSIVYHIINLNSVEKTKNEDIEGKISENYINYPYINVVLDEIELYYHPEWQRRYIYDLLDYIRKINSTTISKIKGINITFLTHSPYILSDIPSSNIIRLDKGKVRDEKEENTLGANIHDLLTHSFFMESTTGEYISQKIQDIIKYYYKIRSASLEDISGFKQNDIEKVKQYRLLVDRIGEDVTKNIVNNHLEFIENQLGIEKV